MQNLVCKIQPYKSFPSPHGFQGPLVCQVHNVIQLKWEAYPVNIYLKNNYCSAEIGTFKGNKAILYYVSEPHNSTIKI